MKLGELARKFRRSMAKDRRDENMTVHRQCIFCNGTGELSCRSYAGFKFEPVIINGITITGPVLGDILITASPLNNSVTARFDGWTLQGETNFEKKDAMLSVMASMAYNLYLKKI